MQTLLSNKTARISLAIFLVALLARVALFFIDYQASGYDLKETVHGDDGYYELTEGILAGRGFSWDTEPPFTPNPLRTPVYPYVAAFFLYLTGSYWVVIGLQMLIGSASAVLAFLIGKKLLLSMWWGVLIGVCMALEPYHVQFSFIFYTETLFIFLFLLFAWQFLRYLEYPSLKNLAISGVLLGVATLTKTTVQFLPILLGVLILWHFRKNLKAGVVHVAMFAAVFVLILSPWLYRNYQTFGVVGMSAQPAFNLITYLVPSVLAVEEGIPISQSTYVADNHIDPNAITLATADLYTAEALAVLKQYPVALIKVGVISVFTFFTHDGMLTVLQHAGYVPESKLSHPALVMAVTDPLGLGREIVARLATPSGLIVLFRLINLGIAVMFVAGALIIIWRKKHSALWVCSLLFVAYFVVTTPINGLGVNARFRMPVEPFILAGAAVSAIALSRRWYHTDSRLPHEQAFHRHPLL